MPDWEGVTIEFTDSASRRRRCRFEPRDPGGWDRFEEEFSAGEWRPVGRDIVANVEIAVAGDVELVEGRRD